MAIMTGTFKYLVAVTYNGYLNIYNGGQIAVNDTFRIGLPYIIG